ncbi:hypothetical protein Taro_046451, partial [Colocasia esculenta]|nr:hypothetical protein [Colocasia esculenta]
GVMKPRLQWPLVIAAYQGLPDFQRERVRGMGFRPIMEIEPFYGHMVPSLEDVTRITGLQVDEEAVTGVTYVDYTEHTQDLLGMEPMGENEHGDRRMVDCIVLLDNLGLWGDPEDRERADRDLRRFLVLFLGKMLLGTKGDDIHYRFLEILEDLERVGQCQAWACGVCDLHVWCWLVSTVLWLVVVERQFDLTFVTARLRGVEVDLCSVEVCGLTFHVLCFYSSLGITVVWRTSGVVLVLLSLFLSGIVRPSGVEVGRLGGPADWAQSAHRFSAYERDKGLRCVLNATALVVTFLLLMFWVVFCMCAACRTLGQHADVDLVKAMPNSVAFSALCSAKGACCGVLLGYSTAWWCFWRVLSARTMRGAGEMPIDYRFLHSSRRQRNEHGNRVGLSFRVVCKEVPEKGFRIRVFACEERQLDLTSVTARLSGSSCVVLSGLVEFLPVVVCPGGGTILVVDPWWYLVVVGEVYGVTFHMLCFYSSLAFLAHTFSDLSKGTGRETIVGQFAPCLQVWSYNYIPLGRATKIWPDAFPLARRWLPVVTEASFSLKLDTLCRDIRDFPALLPYVGMPDDGQPWVESGHPQFGQDLWVHCLKEIEPLCLRLATRTLRLHQAWFDEVKPRGIGRRTRGKAKWVDWRQRFPDQYADWQHGGYPVESDAVDSYAYL